MKRFFYIKLVLVLMLMGSEGRVWAGSYNGTIPNFNFVTTTNGCTATTVNLSAIAINIVSKSQVRVSFNYTLVDTRQYGSGSYDEIFTFGNGPIFASGGCGNNRDTDYTPNLILNSSFGNNTISVTFKATATGQTTGSASRTATLSFQGASSSISLSGISGNSVCRTSNISEYVTGSSYANATVFIDANGSTKEIGKIGITNDFDLSDQLPSFSVNDYFPNLPDNTLVKIRVNVLGVSLDKFVQITSYNPITPNITSKDLSCYGEAITLNSNISNTNVYYNWSGGGVSATSANITVTPNSKTTYSLTVTRGTGSDRVCPVTRFKDIDYFAPFTPTISSLSNDACETDGITLTASPNNIDATYTWTNSNGQTGKNLQVFQANNYTVKVKPNNGCQERESSAIGNNFFFYKRIEGEKIELSKSDGVICANGDNNISLTARATDEGSLSGYLWLGNNGNTQKITVSNAGDYTVIMSRGKCSKQVTQKITKFEFTPSITTPTKSVCDDGTTFEALTSISDAEASQYKFEWTGATGLGDKNKAIITKAGDYQVKITPPYSCPAKTTNTVRYNFDPPFTDVDIRYEGTGIGTKTKPVICGAPEEPSIVLTAFAKDLSDVKYAWNGPNNSSLGATDKITVLDAKDANAREYKLSLTRQSGTCLVTKTISVVGSFTPLINTVTPISGRICNEKGNAVVLTATPNNATDYSYKWFGGTNGTTDLNQTANTLSTKQTGVYSLTMTQLGGNCTPKKAVKTIAVTVDEPILNAKISPDSAVICNPTAGLSLVASADGTDVKYQWTGASSTSPILVVKKQGDYFVTYSRGECVIPNRKITAVESKLIVKLTPESAVSSKPFIICTLGTNSVAFPLQASTNIGGSSLKWYLTGSTDVVDTNKIYNPKKTGDYYAIATNTKFGCTSDPSNKISITVFDNFSVNIDPLNPKELCEGNVQKFTAIASSQNFDYNYVWSINGTAITPSNANFIDAKKEGIYTVAISKDGCKASSVTSKLSTKPSRPIITVLDNAYLESTENTDGATAYQWYYKKANPVSENDTLVGSYSLLKDNTKQIAVRVDEGTYIVKSNRNGCGKRFSNAIFLPKPLAIDILDRNSWNIYPNPATESISIENNSGIPDKAQVDLWSNTGTLISSWTQSGKTSSYNFLNLPSGTYLITINQKEKRLTTKLIKQ
jgi:Secretion system C-terminal sorting domain